MPLTRRVPKRGFTNPFRVEAQLVRLDALAQVPADAEVTPASLADAGLDPDRTRAGEAAGQRHGAAGSHRARA